MPLLLLSLLASRLFLFFFFNDTATTEIYTLSLHDALPILGGDQSRCSACCLWWLPRADRKSTRLNSSHANISYAVFCLKKKKTSAHAELSASRSYTAADRRRNCVTA